MRNKRNNKTVMAIKTLVAVVILAILFSTGVVIGQATSAPQTTTNTNTNLDTSFKPTVETQLVETHTVQYIDRPVTEVKYVERVKRVPIELRNFSDLEELKQWLEDRKNVTTVRFQSTDTIVDCDDYALELQHKALADGYLISLEIIGPSEYNGIFKNSELPPNTLHAINLVIIGNDAYYIEPQTDEVVFAAQLD